MLFRILEKTRKVSVRIFFSIFFRRPPTIDRRALIKNNTRIDPSVKIGPWVVIDGSGGIVKIGEGSCVNAHSWIDAGRSKVEIGSHVEIGPGVLISCGAHNFDDPNLLISEQGIKEGEDIIIENNCWLGMGVVVCPGVKIGNGSVVGAGSVVTQDIPPYSVVVGVPAKIIKKRNPIVPSSASPHSHFVK